MNTDIKVSGSLVFPEGAPARAGEVLNSVDEIYDIPAPRVGMIVYDKSTGTNYIVRSLKAKVINGMLLDDAQVDEYEELEGRTKEELLKRLQGVSENSNGWREPFRRLQDVATFQELVEGVTKNGVKTQLGLNDLHGTSAAATKDYIGCFRVSVDGRPVEVFSSVEGYTTDVWSQRITCAGLVLRNDVVRTETSYSNYSNDAGHKYRQHSYSQKFIDAVGGGVSFDKKGGVKTFCRRHYMHNNVSTWTPWYDVENPYVQSQNYGKKIAIFGGSFAQNMAVNNSNYQFTHEGTSYNLVDYIAEKLGAVAFDDYAVGGQGMRCDDNSPFDVHLINQLRTAQSKDIYDIYIIMGGVNDYWSNEVPLGESTGYASGSSDDEEQNISYCGGLLKAIDYIRVNAPNAKIYTITPFKGYLKDVDWGWNPRTAIRNDYGNTFYEFIQAQKEVAQTKGVPCFDLWAMQGFSGANVYEYYISDLLHPNGKGYQAVADALVEFLAYGLGSGVLDAYAVLPNATNTAKGLMSAEDKRKLDAAGNGATKIVWGVSSNMNDFKTPGVYDIYGERTRQDDNLPILNASSGHSIAARLTVVASTLQPDGNEICVTQFLQLSNRVGGEGTTYVRTYNENNNGMNGWSAWQKQMGMVETQLNSLYYTGYLIGPSKGNPNNPLLNVVGNGLNGMIDNGIYSGIYTDGVEFASAWEEVVFNQSRVTFLESFVLVVINDYAASGQAGFPRHISQLKYAVDAITGQSTVKKRVGTGNDAISWGDWQDIGGSGSNEVDITDAVKAYGLSNLIAQGFAQKGQIYVTSYITLSDLNGLLDTNNKIYNHLSSKGVGFVKLKIIYNEFAGPKSISIEVTDDRNGYYYKYMITDFGYSNSETVKVSVDMTEL